MKSLAARSSVRRQQFLEMAEEWRRLERESAEAEGVAGGEPERT